MPEISEHSNVQLDDFCLAGGGGEGRGYLVHTLNFVHVFSAFFNLHHTITILKAKVHVYAYKRGAEKKIHIKLDVSHDDSTLHSCILPIYM